MQRSSDGQPDTPLDARAPDRITDLVTDMVELVSELYEHPTADAPHTADADRRLRGAITRLEQLAGPAQSSAARPAPGGQAASRGPSAERGDRGEWVEAGWT